MNTIVHFHNINTNHTLRVIMSTVHSSGGEVIHYTKGKDLTIKIKKSIRLASLKHMIEAFGSDGEISITKEDSKENNLLSQGHLEDLIRDEVNKTQIQGNYLYIDPWCSKYETNPIFNPPTA